jgi:hypothetical protein
MDAQAIKNLGGVSQIIGVLIVVWDLLNIHEYLGDLGRVTAWLRARRSQLAGAMRRLLRRPGRSVVVHAGAASGIGIAGGSVTARLTPGPFVSQPDQPPGDQLAAQAEYLNRLRDWIMREVEQRDRAIEEERAQARAALRAEGRRLEGLIGEVRAEVDRLRKLTTGGIGLRCHRSRSASWPRAPGRPGSAGPSWRSSAGTACPPSADRSSPGPARRPQPAEHAAERDRHEQQEPEERRREVEVLAGQDGVQEPGQERRDEPDERAQQHAEEDPAGAGGLPRRRWW